MKARLVNEVIGRAHIGLAFAMYALPLLESSIPPPLKQKPSQMG
jgi:hypothetical protein